MKISYDYSDMIDEIKELIEDEELKLDETVCVLRKYRLVENFGKLINYNPIIDWFYEDAYVSDVDIAYRIIEGDDLEKIKVKDFLAEMEEMNRII